MQWTAGRCRGEEERRLEGFLFSLFAFPFSLVESVESGPDKEELNSNQVGWGFTFFTVGTADRPECFHPGKE